MFLKLSKQARIQLGSSGSSMPIRNLNHKKAGAFQMTDKSVICILKYLKLPTLLTSSTCRRKPLETDERTSQVHDGRVAIGGNQQPQ
jgi:hypothetical protein